jgi:hypothetical protein
MTSVVSLAVKSLEVVLGTYATIKTNAEHLKGLAKRCEIVVDSLQLVVNERGDVYAEQLRIERLVELVSGIILNFRRCLLNWFDVLGLLSKLHLQ